MADKVIPKFKEGDIVRLIKKDQGSLKKPVFDWLMTRKYFTVNKIVYNDKLPDYEDKPYLELGYKHGSREIPFAAYRFEHVPKEEIDRSDPYGEEIYEVGYTFSDKIKKDEAEAIDYIRENIGKFWIQLSDLSNLCRVIDIEEDYNTFKYKIIYSLYKKKSGSKNIVGAKEFTSSFVILTIGMLTALDKQKDLYEKQYESDVNVLKRQYEDRLRKIEQQLKEETSYTTDAFQKNISLIDGIIEFAKKQ